MDAREPEGTQRAPSAAAMRPLAWIGVAWIVCVGLFALLDSVAEQNLALEALRQAAYLAPFFAAAVASARALAASSGRERRFWRALCIGIGLMAVAESYVSARVLLGLRISNGWPEIPVLLGLASSVFVLVGLFRLTDFRTLSGLVRARHIVDATGAALLLIGANLVLVLVPLSRAYEHAVPIEMIVAACYSAVGALLLLATVVNFVSRSWSRWRPCERQVVLGMGVYGLATALWPLWYLGAQLNPGLPWDRVIEVLWMTGMLLVFGGAVTRLRSVGSVAPLFRAVPRMRPRRHGIIATATPVLMVLAVPLFGFLAMTQPVDQVIRGAYAFVGLGLAAVVAVRSAVAAIEYRSLFERAVNDPLTEIFGHRYFHERLRLEIDLAQRHGDTLSVVVVDLDEFSRINRAFGHSRGDDVLRAAAIAIKTACRGSDAACRLGADEFAVVLPAATVDDAEAIGARIRAALRDVDVGEYGPLSASIGIASFPVDAIEAEELVHKADGALYWAKYHGKNRIVVFDESVVESLSARERISKLEEQSHLSTVRALAAAVDARDSLTQFHSQNVAILAVMLAEEMELHPDKRALIEIAALLHDIGKIGISDRVLRKRGPLSVAEMRHIREHPGLGEKILMSTQLVEVLPWVRHHHERWDGAGYPDGLIGESIPLEARLLCICDSYDAMTTGRPYRTALSSSAALQELDLCIGTQFDPALAEMFMRMVGRKRLLRPETRFAREAGEALEAGPA
jgi:diguanylate cyclase (GGDEF)-like protein